VLRGGVFLEPYGDLARAVQIDWWEMGRGLVMIFPTQGCWEITGKIYDIDDSTLTFVVEVRVPR